MGEFYRVDPTLAVDPEGVVAGRGDRRACTFDGDVDKVPVPVPVIG